jgi:flagellar basal-body rod protein FlgB
MSETSAMNDARVEALSRFLDVNVARYRLIASNLANVDTPGYRARDLNFRAELARAGVNGGGGDPGEAYTPVARTVHGLIERPDGNDVSVERETLAMAETQMRFNLGVSLLKDEFHTISLAINSGGGASS